MISYLLRKCCRLNLGDHTQCDGTTKFTVNVGSITYFGLVGGLQRYVREKKKSTYYKLVLDALMEGNKL